MVRGELDLSTAPVLQERVLAALREGREVELDLTAVPFVDSSGLRALILADREAMELGVAFRLLEPLPAQLERLLEVAGMSGRLPTRAAAPPEAADPPVEEVGASGG